MQKLSSTIASLAALTALVLPTSAWASSTHFGEASADGRHVFFETKLALLPADNEDRFDVYDWRAGGATLASVDQTGSNFSRGAHFLDAANDGGSVLFSSYAPLIGADSPPGDSDIDIYRSSGGAITRVSTGPTVRTCGTCFGRDAWFIAASPDLSRVVFYTSDRLTAQDTDNQDDVYAREGGTTTLLSIGPSGGNGDFRVDAEGASASAKSVFFSTSESLVPSDTTPDSYDLYRRSPAGLDRIVPEQFFHQSSSSGDRAIFSNRGRLVLADTDSKSDIYEWTDAGGIRLLTKGAGSRGNGPFSTRWVGQSNDARRIVFYTDERLVPQDNDSLRDLYVAFNGAVKLVSTGPRGGNGPFEPRFGGISANGRFTYFMTQERLVRSDRDRASDLYMRGRGRTTRISRRGGRFAASSANGKTVLFISAKPQDAADRDANPDLYRYSNGRVKLLSRGPRGGNSNARFAYVVFAGATPNARDAYFYTYEKLVAADRDNHEDLYARTRGGIRLITRRAG